MRHTTRTGLCFGVFASLAGLILFARIDGIKVAAGEYPVVRNEFSRAADIRDPSERCTDWAVVVEDNTLTVDACGETYKGNTEEPIRAGQWYELDNPLPGLKSARFIEGEEGTLSFLQFYRKRFDASRPLQRMDYLYFD